MIADDHRVLFIPGPVEVDAELLEIMAQPMIGHRQAPFVAEVKAVCEKLQPLFRTDPTQGTTTLFENAPATALMEAGIRNLVPHGARVLHLTCGAFSERWAKISSACGRLPETLAVDWGQANTADALAAALADDADFAAVCITHNETSTGVRNPLGELAALLRDALPDALILADVVTSLGGAPMEFDGWGLDLAFAGTQKCLALPPGLVVYAVSARAMERAAVIPERGYLLDFLTARDGLADGKTTATPCVPLVFALSRQLDRIAAEGLESRWDRHLAMRDRTLAWALEQGFVPLVEGATWRSPTVTALRAPGRCVPQLAARAKAAGFVLDRGYGRLKDDAFRIGHMGDHTLERLDRLLDALA